MSCRVKYKSSVFRDLKNLDRKAAARILDAIEGELAVNPELGKALTGGFKGLYSYRVGDYRVIYARTGGECILVLRVGHRGKVYKR